jgi:hypothetical protein
MGLARGVEHGSRAVLAHGNFWGAPRSSWTEGGWKLILEGDGTTRLHHLELDPREERDLARSEPQREGAMRARLEGAEAAMAALARGGPAALTAEQRRALTGLGYGSD